jgi:hypothetical protein
MTKFIKIHFEDKQQDLRWLVIDISAYRIIAQNLGQRYIGFSVDKKTVGVNKALVFLNGKSRCLFPIRVITVDAVNWQPVDEVQ